MKLLALIWCIMLALVPIVHAQSLNADSVVTKQITAEKRVMIDESAASLAIYFQSLYKNKIDQLQAAYNWVASHIKYDYDSSYYFNTLDHEAKITATLRRRKGVCENFAVLFADLAARMNIPSFVIHGYAPAAATGKNAAHSWCAVYVNNDWYLCDPTWDAGLPAGNNYFLGTASQYISSHIPFDPIWQLMEKPVGYKRAKNNTIFNYKDSIANFLKSDSLQQYMAIDRRMKQMNTDKELFRVWQSYNRMHIVIIAEEDNMNLYNAAVADLNNATALFNEFVEYRNNKFFPAKTDKEIEKMLDPINAMVAHAKDKINKIGLIVENFQYNTSALQSKLDNLLKRSEEQKLFLKKYLTANITEREQLMYR
ncbi:MAG: transglutaminase domain-containing protein [Chitinophagaceae bacterium]|nr:transglutaminase domain-containing protein [Chitinophagaceae bacterium]